MSNDLVHWAHLPHALDPTNPSKAFPHSWGGPCDGALSFPDLYVTWARFHRFDCPGLDVRGHAQAQGATFSSPRLQLADMVLI